MILHEFPTKQVRSFSDRDQKNFEATFFTATEKLKVIGNCTEECGMLVELGRVDGKIMNN